jgi:hypothetical protein
MAVIVKAECPHCGHSQPLSIECREGKAVVLCNPADGGCGRWYAVFYGVSVTVKSCKISKENEEGSHGQAGVF